MAWFLINPQCIQIGLSNVVNQRDKLRKRALPYKEANCAPPVTEPPILAEADGKGAAPSHMEKANDFTNARPKAWRQEKGLDQVALSLILPTDLSPSLEAQERDARGAAQCSPPWPQAARSLRSR